jgi:exopolysaccharide production protein ExoZ
LAQEIEFRWNAPFRARLASLRVLGSAVSNILLSGVFRPPVSTRIESVQVLRGIAAMLVVFSHAGLFLALAPQYNLGSSYLVPSEAVASMGAIGVDLFFVISGFVMTLGARRFTGPRGAGLFLIQRFVRIAPLFYLACLVMLAEVLRAGLRVETASVFNSLTFIPVFDDGTYSWPLHYLGWTLMFEWVFYLLVAVLIASGRGGRHIPLLVVLAAVPLLGALLDPQLMLGRVLSNPILWEFALGTIACILYERCLLGRFRTLLVSCALLILLTGAVALRVSPEDLVGVGENTIMGENEAAARTLLWGVPAFVFFAAVVGLGDVGDGWLGRLLKRLGDASYSIYLSHLFVVMAMREVLNHLPFDPDLVVVATLALSALVGIGVYRWIEAPLLRLGQRRIRRWSTQYMRPSANIS